MNARRGPDSLGIYLTGGWDNLSPDSSLGGKRSRIESQGLAVRVTNPIPSIKIEYASPTCGVGTGSLSVVANQLVFTPPDSSAGTPIDIAAGQVRVIQGSDDSGENGPNKFLRVRRESGLGFWGTATLTFLSPIHGTLGMGEIPDAVRQAGGTLYRAFLLRAWSHSVSNIKIWLPPVSDSQTTYAIGLEDAVGEAIQIIEDETEAPLGVAFSSPSGVGTALEISEIKAGRCHGLWVRKAITPGTTVAVLEEAKLSIEYEGG